jgi:hypothetical protein
MSIPPIVFILVILLFGFDSTGKVRGRQHDPVKRKPELKVRARHFRFF